MGTEITQAVQLDEVAILRSLNLNPADPNVQALSVEQADAVLAHLAGEPTEPSDDPHTEEP